MGKRKGTMSRSDLRKNRKRLERYEEQKRAAKRKAEKRVQLEHRNRRNREQLNEEK